MHCKHTVANTIMITDKVHINIVSNIATVAMLGENYIKLFKLVHYSPNN